MVPSLTRHEKLVMRLSDRKDLFADKFARRSSREVGMVKLNNGAQLPSANSTKLNGSHEVIPAPISRSKSASSLRQHHRNDSEASGGLASDMSHNSGSNAVWVGDDSQQENLPDSTSASDLQGEAVRSHDDLVASSSDSSHLAKRRLPHRDTHFYETTINYANIPIPIKVPVSAFPEEVGDVGPSQPLDTMTDAIPVLVDSTNQILLLGSDDGDRAIAPPPTYKRCTNPPHHDNFQCNSHA